MDKIYKDFANEIMADATAILEFYGARELEDTLFDVFNDARLQENQPPEILQKRAMLHQTLRSILRTIDQHPNYLKNLLKST